MDPFLLTLDLFNGWPARILDFRCRPAYDPSFTVPTAGLNTVLCDFAKTDLFTGTRKMPMHLIPPEVETRRVERKLGGGSVTESVPYLPPFLCKAMVCSLPLGNADKKLWRSQLGVAWFARQYPTLDEVKEVVRGVAWQELAKDFFHEAH